MGADCMAHTTHPAQPSARCNVTTFTSLKAFSKCFDIWRQTFTRLKLYLRDKISWKAFHADPCLATLWAWLRQPNEGSRKFFWGLRDFDVIHCVSVLWVSKCCCQIKCYEAQHEAGRMFKIYLQTSLSSRAMYKLKIFLIPFPSLWILELTSITPDARADGFIVFHPPEVKVYIQCESCVTGPQNLFQTNFYNFDLWVNYSS